MEKDTRQKSDRITLVITYNRVLPNVIKINCNILQIYANFKEMFKNELITAFKRNKIIQEIIGTHWIKNERFKKNLKTLKEGKCTLCRSKAGNISCKQVKTTTTFKSIQLHQHTIQIA